MSIRLLTFTTLYPDSSRPGHGIFVETRLRHLLKAGGVESRVVAPVPWFPLRTSGEYGAYARVPRSETRNGILVEHPRYPLIPKVGMTPAPLLMALAVKGKIREIIRQGYDFDIIDAHYFYPDGVAAAMIGRQLGKPVVITARGTDLNLIPRYYWPRRQILWAARKAAALITVCQALKDVLTGMGVPDDKVTVLRNGVDLELFRPPDDREALRKELGLEGPTLLSVGYLIPRKGHDLVIRALEMLRGWSLLIAGDGPDLGQLRQLAEELGLASRVRFLGRIDQAELVRYYGAADMLVLASDREGWANVLLESMACGTPVAATRIWGTPEVVAVPEAGVLIEDRTAKGIAEGIMCLSGAMPHRVDTRRYAEDFSWEATSAGQIEVFRDLREKSGSF